MATARKSMDTPSGTAYPSPCASYGQKEYERFLSGEMGKEEREKFKDHALNCVPCCKALFEHYEPLAMRDSEINEALFQRTQKLLDTILTPGNGIYDLVISKAASTIQAVRNAWEELQPMQAAIARGRKENAPLSGPARFVRVFEDPPVSVQVTLEIRGPNEDVPLSLSFLDPKSEEFLSGLRVTLEKHDAREESISDQSGEVHFLLKGIGIYEAYLKEKPNVRVIISLE